jgi:hypothetical protein
MPMLEERIAVMRECGGVLFRDVRTSALCLPPKTH